jgi:hypothetical protein
MAESKAARQVKTVAMPQRVTTQDKIAKAMAVAASQAKKQLAAQGLKLPTQNWVDSVVRNPVA